MRVDRRHAPRPPAHRAAAAPDTRPTSDRVRESLFSILGPLDGERVLDLFAGSGALGIEALSRGAAQRAVRRRARGRAIAAMRANLDALGWTREVVCDDARRVLRNAHARGAAYDLIFLDPPYRQAERWAAELSVLRRVLAPGGRVSARATGAHRSTSSSPLVDERRYGDTLIRIHTHAPDPRIAVCPGSYDPITFGHLDVISRPSELFDEVVVAVVNLPIRKGSTLFDIDERLAFIEDATEHLDNVRAEPFDVLVVEFAQRIGARAIVKGLRAISDFEYEMEMNQLNRRQAPDIDTLYLMASPQYSFLSSSGVKELATFGGESRTLCRRRWPSA